MDANGEYMPRGGGFAADRRSLDILEDAGVSRYKRVCGKSRTKIWENRDFAVCGRMGGNIAARKGTDRGATR